MSPGFAARFRKVFDQARVRVWVGLAALNHAPGRVIEMEQRFRLAMAADRRALRPRFVVKTMPTAVAHVPDNLLGLFTFFDRDHLTTHRHCLLALEATDHLSEIDHFGDIGIFSRYFSNQFAHGSSPDARITTMTHAAQLNIVAGRTDAVPAGRQGKRSFQRNSRNAHKSSGD